MAVQLERGVDFPMVDLANIAYYPRIFDLAHRFLKMHGYLFATFVMPISSWFERQVSQWFTWNPISMHHSVMVTP